MKASHWSNAAAIAAVGLALGLTGIGWGLPSARRVELLGGSVEKVRAELSARSARDLETRRGQAAILATQPAEEGVDLPRLVRRYLLFSDSPDEPLTLLALANFRPRQLDFNPRMAEYGGLHVYGTGAAMALAHAVGFGRITSNVMHYADHPEDIARLYIAGRFLMVLYNVGIAIVLYAFGRKLLKSEIRNQKSEILCGFLTALLWLLSPPSLAFSHIINPHLPAAFWGTLAVWLAWRAGQSPNRRAWFGAAAASGAAASCALNAWLVFLAPVLVALFAWRNERALLWRELGLAALVAIAMFLALNPYFFANLGVLGQEMARFQQFRQPFFGLSSIAAFAVQALPCAFGEIVLSVMVLGMLLWGREHKRKGIWLLIYTMVGLATIAWLAGSEADEPLCVRFVTFLLPSLSLFITTVLGGRRFVVGRVLLGGFVAFSSILTARCYLESFLDSSRDDAGSFINHQAATGAAILTPESPGPYEMPAFDFSRFKLLTDSREPHDWIMKVGKQFWAIQPRGFRYTNSFPETPRLIESSALSFSLRVVQIFRRLGSYQ